MLLLELRLCSALVAGKLSDSGVPTQPGHAEQTHPHSDSRVAVGKCCYATCLDQLVESRLF